MPEVRAAGRSGNGRARAGLHPESYPVLTSLPFREKGVAGFTPPPPRRMKRVSAILGDEARPRDSSNTPGRGGRGGRPAIVMSVDRLRVIREWSMRTGAARGVVLALAALG